MQRHKTHEDVERVIALGKPEKVIDLFIKSYLEGLALAPAYRAEEEYFELKQVPDRETVPAQYDDEGLVLEEQDFNAVRDTRIGALEVEFPHLVEPAPKIAYHEDTDLLTGEITLVPYDLPVPGIDERRPSVTVNVGGFKVGAIADALRRVAYPDIGDQLDAIWKQLNYDRFNGRNLIAEADAVLGDILAVKAKYNKIFDENGE